MQYIDVVDVYKEWEKNNVLDFQIISIKKEFPENIGAVMSASKIVEILS